MGSSNPGREQAGSLARMPASCRLICSTLIIMLLLRPGAWKGAQAKTVLHNESGRDLLLIPPDSTSEAAVEVPAGQSVELMAPQQQKGLLIQDVESGAVAGPLDLPDGQSLRALWSPSQAVANPGNTDTSPVVIKINLGTSLLNINIVGGGGVP